MVTVVGDLAFGAGVTPRGSGTYVGVAGRDVTVEEACAAVANAAEAAVRALREGVGPARRILRIVQFRVMVRAEDHITELPVIADAGSRALAAVLPQSIPPSRTTLGVKVLPGGAVAEVELVAETTRTGNGPVPD